MKRLLCLLAVALAAVAGAQTRPRNTQVYHCGADGRDLRDSPCPADAPGPAASNVRFDQPSAADSRAARDRHLDEAKRAAALAQIRRQSEADARHERSRAVGLQTVQPAAPAASAADEGAKPGHPYTVKGPKPPKPPKEPKAPKPASGAHTG